MPEEKDGYRLPGLMYRLLKVASEEAVGGAETVTVAAEAVTKDVTLIKQ